MTTVRTVSRLSNRVERWQRGRRVMAAAGALLLIGTLAAAARPSAHQTVTPISGFLRGISAVSTSDAWAVGSAGGPSNQPLIVHWDGTSWSQVTSPAAPFGNLYGVSMVSATDGWAVGTCHCKTGGILILHWNGTSWTRLPAIAPSNGSLRGVSMVSATDGWAVGLVGSSQGPSPLALHWNGIRWTQVPVPVPGSVIELDSVSAASASDAWAVGSAAHKAIMLRWNGSTWTQVPTARSTITLMGAADASVSDAWAVGISGTATGPVTLALHWNGAAWAKTPSPSPGHQVPGSSVSGNELAGAAIISGSDAWAVGDYTPSSGRQTPLTMHWNDAAWARVPNPIHCGGTCEDFLTGISMVSVTNGWAVGGNYDNQVIILHWNGTSWTQS